MAVMAGLLVLVTFLFWYQTWFGRRLTESEFQEYLTDTSVPHKTQHALSQLALEIARGDPSARRWYPQVLVLAGNQEPELRQMAAWVMGQDGESAEFHQALLKLLKDPEPMVEWNTALALVRFGDASGEPQLRQMLRAYTLSAAQAGTISFRLKESDAARNGSVVAWIKTPDSRTIEIRSPLAGEVEKLAVKEGARVAPRDAIAVLSPGEEQVWEALRALYLVGQPEDLADVERYARGAARMTGGIQQQAALTAQEIRNRAARKKIQTSR